MHMPSALAFASALTLTLQFLIFVYLYTIHPAKYFQYLLFAWGLMSLAKGLHLARSFVPDLDFIGALINATFFAATLLVLASGLVFRSNYTYKIGRRDIVIGVVGALAAASFGDLADASAGHPELGWCRHGKHADSRRARVLAARRGIAGRTGAPDS